MVGIAITNVRGKCSNYIHEKNNHEQDKAGQRMPSSIRLAIGPIACEKAGEKSERSRHRDRRVQ